MIKQIFLILLCIGLSTNGWSQEDKEVKRTQTEKNTKPFELNYFTSNENRFYVLEVAVINKAVVIDSTAIVREVPGKLPYPTGNFNVSVVNENNEVIADYQMPDPVLQRSCEDGKNNLAYLENGRILIALPKNNTIDRVILRRDKEEVSNLDIGALIREIPRKDPEKN